MRSRQRKHVFQLAARSMLSERQRVRESTTSEGYAVPPLDVVTGGDDDGEFSEGRGFNPCTSLPPGSLTELPHHLCSPRGPAVIVGGSQQASCQSTPIDNADTNSGYRQPLTNC
jgi:hypothetical protein